MMADLSPWGCHIVLPVVNPACSCIGIRPWAPVLNSVVTLNVKCLAYSRKCMQDNPRAWGWPTAYLVSKGNVNLARRLSKTPRSHPELWQCAWNLASHIILVSATPGQTLGSRRAQVNVLAFVIFKYWRRPTRSLYVTLKRLPERFPFWDVLSHCLYVF